VELHMGVVVRLQLRLFRFLYARPGKARHGVFQLRAAEAIRGVGFAKETRWATASPPTPPIRAALA
jgi:hypothetical protein